MIHNQKNCSPAGVYILLLVLVNTILLKENLFTTSSWYWVLYLTIPLLLVAAFRMWRSTTKR